MENFPFQGWEKLHLTSITSLFQPTQGEFSPLLVDLLRAISREYPQKIPDFTRRLFDLPSTILLIDCFCPRLRRRQPWFFAKTQCNSILKFTTFRAKVVDLTGTTLSTVKPCMRNKCIGTKLEHFAREVGFIVWNFFAQSAFCATMYIFHCAVKSL